MPARRLGAHTFIFQQYGLDHVKQTEKILDTIAEAGFDAVEFHHPVLTGDDYKARIETALRHTGLQLVGASQGQPLWNQAEYDRILDVMDVHAERLSSLGEGLRCGLSCSGKHMADRSDDENRQAVQVWTELGEIYRSQDLALAYHNHGEPLPDIAFVLDNVDEDLLSLCPDLDWLRVGGVDPLGFLRDHGSRISMIHVRDYRSGGERTVSLGEGDLDLAGMKAALDDISFSGDLIVELALPSGTRPDRPLLDILRESRDRLRDVGL
jgi:inosose dehydratase